MPRPSIPAITPRPVMKLLNDTEIQNNSPTARQKKGPPPKPNRRRALDLNWTFRASVPPRYSASSSAMAASSASVAWTAGSKIFVEMGRPLTFTAALMAETNRSHTS